MFIFFIKVHKHKPISRLFFDNRQIICDKLKMSQSETKGWNLTVEYHSILVIYIWSFGIVLFCFICFFLYFRESFSVLANIFHVHCFDLITYIGCVCVSVYVSAIDLIFCWAVLLSTTLKHSKLNVDGKFSWAHFICRMFRMDWKRTIAFLFE